MPKEQDPFAELYHPKNIRKIYDDFKAHVRADITITKLQTKLEKQSQNSTRFFVTDGPDEKTIGNLEKEYFSKTENFFIIRYTSTPLYAAPYFPVYASFNAYAEAELGFSYGLPLTDKLRNTLPDPYSKYDLWHNLQYVYTQNDMDRQPGWNMRVHNRPDWHMAHDPWLSTVVDEVPLTQLGFDTRILEDRWARSATKGALPGFMTMGGKPIFSSYLYDRTSLFPTAYRK